MEKNLLKKLVNLLKKNKMKKRGFVNDEFNFLVYQYMKRGYTKKESIKIVKEHLNIINKNGKTYKKSIPEKTFKEKFFEDVKSLQSGR